MSRTSQTGGAMAPSAGSGNRGTSQTGGTRPRLSNPGPPKPVRPLRGTAQNPSKPQRVSNRPSNPPKPNKPNKPGLNTTQWRKVTMGPISRAIRAKATPAQWNKLVKMAHAAGLTVEGYLDQSVPYPLKERLRRDIESEATQRISRLYKPAFRELTDQAKRIQALDEKRKNDNAYYLDWLNRQSRQLDADAKQADSLLDQQTSQINEETSQHWQDVANSSLRQMVQQPGMVSDLKQSKAYMDLGADQLRMLQQMASDQNAQQRSAVVQQDASAATTANNFAIMATAEAKRVADTWNRLKDVADAKGKLRLEQGAASAKEVARLLDQEISKAESNRDIRVAMERLDLEADKLATDRYQAQLDYLNDRDKTRETGRHNRAQEKLAYLEYLRKKYRDQAQLKLDAKKLGLERRKQESAEAFNRRVIAMRMREWDLGRDSLEEQSRHNQAAERNAAEGNRISENNNIRDNANRNQGGSGGGSGGGGGGYGNTSQGGRKLYSSIMGISSEIDRLGGPSPAVRAALAGNTRFRYPTRYLAQVARKYAGNGVSAQNYNAAADIAKYGKLSAENYRRMLPIMYIPQRWRP